MSGQTFLIQRDEETCEGRLNMMEEVLNLDGLPSTKYRRICELVDGYEWDDSDVNLLQKVDIPSTGNIRIPPQETGVDIGKDAGGLVASSAKQPGQETRGSSSQISNPSQPSTSVLSDAQRAVIEANRLKSIQLRDSKRLEKELAEKKNETDALEGGQWL